MLFCRKTQDSFIATHRCYWKLCSYSSIINNRLNTKDNIRCKICALILNWCWGGVMSSLMAFLDRLGVQVFALLEERVWLLSRCWVQIVHVHRSPLSVWVGDGGGLAALNDCRVEKYEQLPLYFLQLQFSSGFMMMMLVFKVLTVAWWAKKKTFSHTDKHTDKMFLRWKK